MSRCCPLIPSTLNNAQSVGNPLAPHAEHESPLSNVVQVGHPVGQLGRVVDRLEKVGP